MIDDKVDMTKCMANGCPNPPIHLVDFTTAGIPGVTWLPMCDACKKIDDALMAFITSSPENAEKARVAINAARDSERQ